MKKKINKKLFMKRETTNKKAYIRKYMFDQKNFFFK